jgi:hypothetical protein
VAASEADGVLSTRDRMFGGSAIEPGCRTLLKNVIRIIAWIHKQILNHTGTNSEFNVRAASL